MEIQAQRTDYKEVEALRGLYRQEANCQIIHDSFLSRGLADPYLILVDGRVAGYGAVANRYEKDQAMEFYTLPQYRSRALPMFREMLAVSQATSIQAQTNMPLMLTLIYDCATDITPQSILFADAAVTHLACPDGLFRRVTPNDPDPKGKWGLDIDGTLVAWGASCVTTTRRMATSTWRLLNHSAGGDWAAIWCRS
jgi:hypothetical protein